ncbi:hypothetical protein LIER_42588 [Lithospermum erythrorhizon]|uniref:Uncharacterized protein n=1 Tax=Lithospermum erythrorhizon TaxID=34254 RepID=A0AAV3NJT3_LITER
MLRHLSSGRQDKTVASGYKVKPLVPVSIPTEVATLSTFMSRATRFKMVIARPTEVVLFQTLMSRIASQDASWGDELVLHGEFRYKVVRTFCENWSPSTNTLVTTAGELSISLWDIHKFGGLPILGDLFDEVDPSSRELTGTSRGKQRFLPQTCEYLFHAFHLLLHRSKGDELSIFDYLFGVSDLGSILLLLLGRNPRLKACIKPTTRPDNYPELLLSHPRIEIVLPVSPFQLTSQRRLILLHSFPIGYAYLFFLQSQLVPFNPQSSRWHILWKKETKSGLLFMSFPKFIVA